MHAGSLRVYYRRNDGLRLNAQDLRKDLAIQDRWQLIDDDEKPDLVVIGSHLKHRRALLPQMLAIRHRFGFNCFLLVISQEVVLCSFPGVDYSISFKADSANNYYLGVINNYMEVLEYFLENKESDKHRDVQQNRSLSSEKKYFCNYIYGNDYANLYEGVRIRQEFCKQLSRYKRVDCAGISLNNTNRLKDIEKTISGGWDAKLEFMKDYKFSIIFENQSLTDYITEKIWHAYMAGTIPIYWGSPNISKYFNPASFVNCHDYLISGTKNPDLPKLIAKIKEIDKDETEFMKYLNSNPVAKNSLLYNFSKDKISHKTEQILEMADKKKEHTKNLKHPQVSSLTQYINFVLRNLIYLPYCLVYFIKNLRIKERTLSSL